jgi:hypothetical protein
MEKLVEVEPWPTRFGEAPPLVDHWAPQSSIVSEPF